MYTLIKRSISYTDNGFSYRPWPPTWAIAVPAVFGALILLLMIATCISRFSSSKSGYTDSDGGASTGPELAPYSPRNAYTDWGISQNQGAINFTNNGGHIGHHHGVHSSAHHVGCSSHGVSAPPAYDSGFCGGGGHSVAATPAI